MKKVTPTSSRKGDHIRINLEEDVASGITTNLEKYHFVHQALPEINLENVDTNVDILNKQLNAPVLISSMTGGTPESREINRILAQTAQSTGVALGIGSQRAAIEQQSIVDTFQVRHVAPDILLFANLGAIQLAYGLDVDACQRAVDMIEADALILHLNPLQEALQPEGNTRFDGLLPKIESVCKTLKVPVIAKEVGWGISAGIARQLIDAGVSVIDVAGAGGTSWSQVEMHRAENAHQSRIAGAFPDWGIPTADSIIQVSGISEDIEIFASGGLRTGVDICKCIALGASLGGIAGPFLRAASDSLERTIGAVHEIQQEIKICMFAAGANNIDQLKRTQLVKI